MQNRTPIAAEARPPLPDFTPVPRIAGEADWVEAGGDIPEGYREWIKAAEATPAVPMKDAVADGVAAVRKRPSWRKAGKAKGAE